MASRRPPTDPARPSATRSPPPITSSPTIASNDGPPPSSSATAAEAAAVGKKTPAPRKRASRAKTTEAKPADMKAPVPTAVEPKTTDDITGKSVTIKISEDVRRGMIAQAAYLRAERRGFFSSPEQEREDWHAAEEEVDALLRESHGSSKQ